MWLLTVLTDSPIYLLHVLAFGLAGIACFLSLQGTASIDHDDTRTGLQALLVTSGLWASAQAGFLLIQGDGIAVLLYQIGLAAGFATIGAWLYLCSAYTGRRLHKSPTIRRVALGVFGVVVAVKIANPIHGLYFTAVLVSEPFPHLAIRHGPLHWVAMAFAYSLTMVGYAALLEFTWERGGALRPFTGMLALPALTAAITVASVIVPGILELSYEPLGVAAFAIGILYVYREEFENVRLISEHDDPVIVLDEDGHVRDFNDGAVSLFPELAVGMQGQTVAPGFEAALTEGTAVIEADLQDDTRYYELSETPVAGTGHVLTISDVTERERYRQDLERQNERLEEFAGMVSHDLRNPLMVAQGHIDLVREEYDSEMLDTATTALDRMEILIENMLALARQGQVIDETESVSLEATATSCWTVIDAQDATLHVEDDLTIQADPERLSQLLENLFRNAIDHGGSDVTITLGPLQPGQGFFIADDGPGIPAERRDRIFESGYTTNTDGTGFGLAIVSEIVEAHGWSIACLESDNGGARFEISDVEVVSTQ